jgi:hypothetical protein
VQVVAANLPLRGSLDRSGAGKTHCQPHSSPARGYFLSRAYGKATPLRFSFRSCS